MSPTSRLAHRAACVLFAFAASTAAAAQVPLVRPATASAVEPLAPASLDAIEAVTSVMPLTAEDAVGRLTALALYARARPDDVYAGWRLVRDHPVAAEALRVVAADSGVLAVYYASVARDPNRLANLLRALPADSDAGTAARTLRLLQETVDDVLRERAGAPSVTLYASGDVRGVATGEDRNAAATGALGLLMQRGGVTVQSTLTLASTADSLTSGFGGAVLSPASGRALSSGTLSSRIRLERKWLPSAVYLYGSVASSRWHDTVAVDGVATATAANAVTLGAGVLAWHELACCTVIGNPAVLNAQWGVGLRHLGGDARRQPPLLETALGTRTRTFVGFEGGLQLTVGQVIGSLQLYHLFGRGSADVDGLTGFQVVTAFTVAADVFTGPLTR